MKKLLLALAAAAALALPTAASAHHRHGFGLQFTAVEQGMKLGWFGHSGNDEFHSGSAAFEKLSGTGSSFAASAATASGTIAGRPLTSGTFSASLSTDWTKATANEHGGSCAPSTATLSMTDSSSSANTLGTSVTGMTCSVASNPLGVVDVFFGQANVTSATGTLSSISGDGRVLLAQKTDGTVTGFAFVGFHGGLEHTLVASAAHDEHHCDGSH